MDKINSLPAKKVTKALEKIGFAQIRTKRKPFIPAPSGWENHFDHCASGRRYWERDDKKNNKRR
jgi:hypothetical protein